jgi:hypothetical protein
MEGRYFECSLREDIERTGESGFSGWVVQVCVKSVDMWVRTAREWSLRGIGMRDFFRDVTQFFLGSLWRG